MQAASWYILEWCTSRCNQNCFVERACHWETGRITLKTSLKTLAESYSSSCTPSGRAELSPLLWLRTRKLQSYPQFNNLCGKLGLSHMSTFFCEHTRLRLHSLWVWVLGTEVIWYICNFFSLRLSSSSPRFVRVSYATVIAFFTEHPKHFVDLS